MKKIKIPDSYMEPKGAPKSPELNLDEFLQNIKIFLNVFSSKPSDEATSVYSPVWNDAINTLQDNVCKLLTALKDGKIILTPDGKRFFQYIKEIEGQIFVSKQHPHMHVMRTRRDFLLRKLIHDMKNDCFH